jgi:hypothetical protein
LTQPSAAIKITTALAITARETSLNAEAPGIQAAAVLVVVIVG